MTARRQRLVQWSRILGGYFTMQTATQFISLLAGLIVVREMPVERFALYTLATSVVTFFGFMADLGTGGSLVHFFHRSVRGEGEFAPMVDAVLSLRRLAFAAGAVIVGLSFPWVALAKGFPPREVALVTPAILLAVWFQIHAAIRLLLLRLRSRYGTAYRAEFEGGLARLAGTAACALAGALRSWILVAISAGGAWITVRRARLAGEGQHPAARSTAGDRWRVIRYLLPTLPSALYFSIQGTLVVWIATAFGGQRMLAEVGALGRLGMIVGVTSGLTVLVFLPRLAGVSDEALYRRRFFQFGAFLALTGAAVVAAGAALPGPFLAILGVNYGGLKLELVLMLLGAALSLLDGYIVSVNTARSWTRWQAPALGVLFVAQVAMISFFRLDSTLGVLNFRLGTTLVGMLTQLAIALTGFSRPAWVLWRA